MTDTIIQTVADYYGLEPEDLTGRSRKYDIVEARHMAIYITTQLTRFTLKRIGDAFGGRDHCSIIHARKKMHGYVKVYPETKRDADVLLKKVEEAITA